jgi:hypothetical protein
MNEIQREGAGMGALFHDLPNLSSMLLRIVFPCEYFKFHKGVNNRRLVILRQLVCPLSLLRQVRLAIDLAIEGPAI